jgi:hypothetical protein
VPDLSAMIDAAKDITRRTFIRHCDVSDIAAALGYEEHPKRGLTMAADWSISYHRSSYRGARVYFFCWSHIEHVFCALDLDKLDQAVRT